MLGEVSDILDSRVFSDRSLNLVQMVSNLVAVKFESNGVKSGFADFDSRAQEYHQVT